MNASTLSSMLASGLPRFLDKCSLSPSSLGCKALCIVVQFFFSCFKCLSSVLVHFKNDPEYLSRWAAQVFIPLIRFLQFSLVSSRLLVLQR